MSERTTESKRPEKAKMARVRNNSRCSLLVKVPGQAIHLQPGASAEVPHAYLRTEELDSLLRSGAVIEVKPLEVKPAAASWSEPEVVPVAPRDGDEAPPCDAPAPEEMTEVNPGHPPKKSR